MSAFGLDIGTYSIKAVQYERHGDKFKLLGAGITSAPKEGMFGTTTDLKQISEAIKKLLSDTKLNSQEVNIALPEDKVFTRVITLPPLTDAEVASAISWQAEPYIPIPIKQANVDHQIIERRKPQNGKPGGVDVLLVAASKELTQKYVDVAELAGLTVVGIETELISLSRALSYPAKTVMITDLGATSTDIGIARNGQVLVSRSVDTAGNILTRSAATSLSLNPKQAEEYKKAYGLSSNQLEGKVKTALEPTFRMIVDEMRKTIQYYKNEMKRTDNISTIIVSGGTSGMPGITSYLAQNLGLEVIIGDPFANVIKDERIDKTFRKWAPLYGIASGLAQRI